MLTKLDLINKTKGFAKEIMGMDFNIPINFSKKMTRTYGYFQHRGNIPVQIKYSEDLLGDNFNESTVDSIILHELAHWYLFMTNKPYRDGDTYFKNYVTRIGGSLTGTISRAGHGYQGICSCCNKHLGVYSAKKAEKVRNGNYISLCCRDKVIVTEDKVRVEDTYERPAAKEQWIEDVIAKYSVKNNIKAVVTSPKQVKEVANIPKKTEKQCKKKYDGMTLEQLKQLKRVSNAQMIPSIKMAIDNNDLNEIIGFKNTYEDVYISSLKYLGKTYTQKLNNIMIG